MKVRTHHRTGRPHRVSASFHMLATLWRTKRVRALPCVLLLFALGMITGCKPEATISKYTAPYEPVIETVRPDAPEAPSSGERILALVGEPADDSEEWWFFKMKGRPLAVGRRYDDLLQFATTLKLPKTKGELPQYVTPPSWEQVKSQQKFSLFAFQTGHRFTPLNIEVSKVGGNLLENLNRWRVQQLGLDAWTQAQLDKMLNPDGKDSPAKPEIKVLPTPPGAKKIYLVDIAGPGPKAGGNQMPPFLK